MAFLQSGDQEIAASTWQATNAGAHHLAGIAGFALTDANGKTVLQNENEVTLIIRSLANGEGQTFTWKSDE